MPTKGQRPDQYDDSNAMWGWIVGTVVLALVLAFVLTRG